MSADVIKGRERGTRVKKTNPIEILSAGSRHTHTHTLTLREGGGRDCSTKREDQERAVQSIVQAGSWDWETDTDYQQEQNRETLSACRASEKEGRQHPFHPLGKTRAESRRDSMVRLP